MAGPTGGTQNLTLRMHARGTQQVNNDLNRTSKNVRQVGRSSKESSGHVSVFSRSLAVLQTRMGMVIIAALLMTATLGPPLLAVLALLTAAMVALGAAVLPVFAIVAGAMQRFKDTSGIAGSAASELTDVLNALKSAWNFAISPAASVFMRALSASIVTLLPFLRSLRGPLRDFAQVLGEGMKSAAEGVAALGPEFRDLLARVTPLAGSMAAAIAPLLGTLIDVGMAGVPVLQQLVDWLVQFSFWLRPAIRDLIAWGQSAQAANLVATLFGIAGAAGAYLWGVLQDLWGIATQLFAMFQGEGTLGGQALLWVFTALADAIHWVNVHFQELQPLIYGLVTAFAAYRLALMLANGIMAIWNGLLVIAEAATTVWTAAVWLLDAALAVLTSPITLVVLALVGLAGAIYYAYTHSETFRGIVDAIWGLLQQVPGAVADVANALMSGLGAAVDFIAPKLQYLLDLLGKVTNIAVGPSTGGGLGAALRIAGKGIGLPFMAGGGDVSHSGPHVVGEEGPEVVNLRRGDHVTPNGALGGDTWIAATFVMPDGTVLARQTVRAARKKASTR